MPRLLALGALAWATALATPAIARADVTVIYAPASAPAPLIARPVPGVERPPEARERPRWIDAPPPVQAPPQPLAPTPRAASPTAPPTHVAPIAPTPAAAIAPSPCPTAVMIVRIDEGRDERVSLPLMGCDGRPDAESLVSLSVVARPRTLTAPPSPRELAEHATHPELVAPGIRRLHPGLLERLRAIADRFPGHAIEIVSGSRPDARSSSRHLLGLALDVRVVGASLDTVHAFVSRFPRTGVGLYPATGFLHVDVRERSTHWVDPSAPGEPPRVERVEGPRAPARPASPPAAAPSPASTIPRRSRAPQRDEDELDPAAIADQIMRDLGTIPLPLAPR